MPIQPDSPYPQRIPTSHRWLRSKEAKYRSRQRKFPQSRCRHQELIAWIQDGVPQPVSDWKWHLTVPMGAYQKKLDRLVSRIRKTEKKLSAFCERLGEAEKILDDRRPVPPVSR